MVVDLLDVHVLVAADRGGGRRRIGGVLPVKDDVVGRERRAVVPLHTLLEFPDDGLAILGEAAVFQVWNLGGKQWIERAIGIPARQRLIEDARAVLVLGSDREMRIEQ